MASVRSPFSRSAEREAGEGDRPVSLIVASSEQEIALHHRIRHEEFVIEQGFFDESDRDEHDDDPATVKILGLCGSVAGGAVRIYPLDDSGLWKGDRLAVLALFRPRGLGARLVRFAVATAGERGGVRMVARIQPQNVAFFRRLGWERIGEPGEYVGRLHQEMSIRLSRS